jgi:hypothetical protein
MTKRRDPDNDLMIRIRKLEDRIAILESGPKGDTKSPAAVRSATTVGTKHVAAATPAGGESGDIQVGTSKIWVNDGGTWKSVAIA